MVKYRSLVINPETGAELRKTGFYDSPEKALNFAKIMCERHALDEKNIRIEESTPGGHKIYEPAGG